MLGNPGSLRELDPFPAREKAPNLGALALLRSHALFKPPARRGLEKRGESAGAFYFFLLREPESGQVGTLGKGSGRGPRGKEFPGNFLTPPPPRPLPPRPV